MKKRKRKQVGTLVFLTYFHSEELNDAEVRDTSTLLSNDETQNYAYINQKIVSLSLTISLFFSSFQLQMNKRSMKKRAPFDLNQMFI